MSSPRPSLASTVSMVSTTDGDSSDDQDSVFPVPVPCGAPTSTQTNITVGRVQVDKGAEVPGVLHGPFNKTTFINNFYINPAAESDDLGLVTDAAIKINKETASKFIPCEFKSSLKSNPNVTKEDVDGLTRRWCYLISALITLSLVTLLGTAALYLASWRSSQGEVISPDTQDTIDSLSAEEKHFAELPGGPPIVTRAAWLAAPPRAPLDPNTLPATLVVVCHTATEGCSAQPECIESVRAVQAFHRDSRGWDDIAYNFVVGGDGSVYWGRGFAFQGAHTKGFNNGSVGVAFLGYYSDVAPSSLQVSAFDKLVQAGVREGRLSPDYALVAQCQLKVTAAPGRALVSDMEGWPHFNTSLPVQCTDG